MTFASAYSGTEEALLPISQTTSKMEARLLHAAAARLKKVYPTFVCGQSPVRVRSVQNPHLHLQEICGKSRARCDSVLRGRRTDGRLSNTNGFSEEPRARSGIAAAGRTPVRRAA